MGDTRGVLVRQVEWTEWLPVAQDENEPRLTIANGVTGFEAGKNETAADCRGAWHSADQARHRGRPDEALHALRLQGHAGSERAHHDRATLVEAQGSNEEGEVSSRSGPPASSPLTTATTDPTEQHGGILVAMKTSSRSTAAQRMPSRSRATSVVWLRHLRHHNWQPS